MYPLSYPPRDSGTPSGHILIADDDECLRYLLKSIVEQANYTAEVAADGDKAIALFSRDPSAFSLVLLDVNMPRVSGDEVLRKLRSMRRDLPVVLISGYETESLREWATVAPTAFLQKPFNLDSIRKILARFACPLHHATEQCV